MPIWRDMKSLDQWEERVQNHAIDRETRKRMQEPLSKLAGETLRRMRHVALISVLLAAVGCSAGGAPPRSQSPGHMLTEAEAVATAERFVRVNGYVRAEDADPKQMQVERNLTYGSTPEELLPGRAGKLLPRACGVLPEAVRGFEKGWSVLFCYNPAHPVWRELFPDWRTRIRQGSRVVVMDPYGADIFIPHPNYALTGPGVKRLPGMDDFERLLADQPP